MNKTLPSIPHPVAITVVPASTVKSGGAIHMERTASLNVKDDESSRRAISKPFDTLKKKSIYLTFHV